MALLRRETHAGPLSRYDRRLYFDKLPNIFLLMIGVRLIICLENDIIIVKQA